MKKLIIVFLVCVFAAYAGPSIGGGGRAGGFSSPAPRISTPAPAPRVSTPAPVSRPSTVTNTSSKPSATTTKTTTKSTPPAKADTYSPTNPMYNPALYPNGHPVPTGNSDSSEECTKEKRKKRLCN